MKSQGMFEYILLLMGIVIVVLMVINALLQSAQLSTTEINRQINYAYSIIKKLLKQVIS